MDWLGAWYTSTVIQTKLRNRLRRPSWYVLLGVHDHTAKRLYERDYRSFSITYLGRVAAIGGSGSVYVYSRTRVRETKKRHVYTVNHSILGGDCGLYIGRLDRQAFREPRNGIASWSHALRRIPHLDAGGAMYSLDVDFM